MKAIKSTEVWVVCNPNEYKISDIFLNKEDADSEYNKLHKEKYDFYRNGNKSMSIEEFENWIKLPIEYSVGKVMTLTEALAQIVEEAEERFVEHGPEY
jgi:C4-type Zn-finger protein